MSRISLQVSVYPLRQPDLGPVIGKVLDTFRSRGLDAMPGTMSTVVIGEADAVFDALEASFAAAAALGDVVMTATLSNACALPAAKSHADPERAP
jgi:uncharacterized protein YqgV (UPF0045/DUF77 family)